MDITTPVMFDLYIPSCTESDGHSQPLATALSLNAGKNSCHQHFLQKCRTYLQRLPPDQRAAVPAKIFDAIQVQWSALPSGTHEGKPEGFAGTSLAALANLTYQLNPKA